jgi:hypothetical protein
MTNAFISAVHGGKQFDDVLKSLALRLSDLSLRMARAPITRSIGSGINQLFAGLFATGGGGGKSGVVLRAMISRLRWARSSRSRPAA